MPFRAKPLGPRILTALTLLAAGWGAVAPAGAIDTTSAEVDPAARLLGQLHPDFSAYVGAVRPLGGEARGTASPVYMALVRPGAGDPIARASAPLAGSGARNDILYDPGVLGGARSVGWTMLLLDHEYFHARHLAGATSLPLPPRTDATLEHHFYEAAAWGFSVAQARAGRYPGLREDEFREALDRYGDHYRALRSLAQAVTPAQWNALSDPLLEPLTLVTTQGSRPSEAPSHPSGSGR
jgi:hypothetical protein